MLEWIINFIVALSAAVGTLYFTRTVFFFVGLFTTRRFPQARKNHKYAILIAARNEETVIKNLIHSIRGQDYPAELVDIFVVADNCTDRTAAIARQWGAICYERFDPDHRTKGYALQFLVEQIRRDYGIDAYEAYMIFDADNLLKRDFISKMNDAFDAGEQIVTSYRHTKNLDDNWISASYALHWLRTVRTEHRARSVFRLATRLQGTGFLFSWQVIEKGWNYTSLTEDRAFSADAVVRGYRISYQHDAVFYDEQPTDLKIAMRQRIRWAKGHLLGFVETGGKLFTHIFYTKDVPGFDGKGPILRRLGKSLHFRFMSFDMLSICYPRGMLLFLKNALLLILRSVQIFAVSYAFVDTAFAPALVQGLCKLLHISVAPSTAVRAWGLLLLFAVVNLVTEWLGGMCSAAYILFIERRRMPKMSLWRQLWFCTMFPMFDIMGKLASCVALVTRVEWKPIPHKSDVNIEQLDALHK